MALVLLIAAAFVVVDRNESGPDDRAIDTFAPDVTVGNADLVVLSTTFDAQGARTPIPAALATSLGQVDGVDAAEGVLRTFLPVRDPSGDVLGQGLSTIALSWNGTAGLELHEGRPPANPGEIAIEQSTLEDAGLAVGDTVQVPRAVPDVTGTVVGSPDAAATIVGSFTLAGGDAGVPGVAVTAFDAASLLALTPSAAAGTPGFDRIDLIANDDIDPVALARRVTSTLPTGLTVVSATELGSREQLRAELEIQRAFYDLLSPDEPTRNSAIESGDQETAEQRAEGARTFERYLGQIQSIEFRVQRFSFLDADHARVVFMTYYSGSPSPILTQPFDANVVRIGGRWKISSETVCTLAILGGSTCIPQPGRVVPPPPGWDAPADHADVVAAFTAATPPGITLVVSGVRVSDATHAQVFYSLTAPSHPALETPYPLVGDAVLVAGRWQPTPGYTCGLDVSTCPPGTPEPTAVSTASPTTVVSP